MEILYLLKREPDETVKEFMAEHGKLNSVTVVDMRVDKDYSRIINLIEKCDRIISW